MCRCPGRFSKRRKSLQNPNLQSTKQPSKSCATFPITLSQSPRLIFSIKALPMTHHHHTSLHVRTEDGVCPPHGKAFWITSFSWNQAPFLWLADTIYHIVHALWKCP